MKRGLLNTPNGRILGLSLFAAFSVGCGCKGLIPTDKATMADGSEPNLALLYIDDSDSMNFSDGKGDTYRKQASQYALRFLKALHASDDEKVAVRVTTFRKDYIPGSFLRLGSRQKLMEEVLSYEDHGEKEDSSSDKKDKKRSKDDPSGTGFLNVLNDAKERLTESKAKNKVILLLTDGGIDDPDPKAVENAMRSVASLPGVHFVIAGVSSENQGRWRRFAERSLKGIANAKVGNTEADSEAAVTWAAEQFNKQAGG